MSWIVLIICTIGLIALFSSYWEKKQHQWWLGILGGIVVFLWFMQLRYSSSDDNSSSSSSKIKDTSKISSIEEANNYLNGKTFMAIPRGGMEGFWWKITFSNGSYTLWGAWPSAGSWTEPPRTGTYTVEKMRYDDTGQSFFYVQISPCLLLNISTLIFGDCKNNTAKATEGNHDPWD
jgi:hypothetical protein